MNSAPPFRCPTRSAINSLAKRFGLPNGEFSQDWEHEVADPARLHEFLSAYETQRLDEDERFCLMEIIIQSFEDSDSEVGTSPEWLRIEKLLRANTRLHAYTLWYWACFDLTVEDAWRVSPAMRTVIREHT